MGTDRPDDLSAAKAEALALAGRIRDLRAKAEEHRAIAERERINADSFPEGSYEAGFSLFLSQDHEEKADDADKGAATLVCKHANATEPFSNHTTWEENGVTMCCECEGLFLIETLGGRFMARTCPLCGKRIHEWGYDDQGRRLARRLSNMRRNGAEGCRETEEELERLALARYLASEWYLLSGTPTSAGGFDATEEGYSFVPSYSKKGQFCLKARYGKNVVHGVFGEMTLFDLLRTCVNDKQSPLYGGKIVPNVFLAKSSMKKGRLRIRQNQTDCVFLHPEGVVVFEVKRWLSHILVDAMRDEIAVTKKDGITKYGSGKGPSAQVMAARKALFSEVAGLDGRRVCSMVVFVNPLSMSGDPGEPTSRKHVYFGQLHKGGTGTVRKAVEQCISIWRKRDDGAKKLDVVSIAEKLLDECSCHILPLNPKGRMGG